MQIVILLLGLLLILFGLVFALRGDARDVSRGTTSKWSLEGPAWLLVVAIGVSLVLIAAFRDWDDEVSSEPLSQPPVTEPATPTSGAAAEATTTIATTTTLVASAAPPRVPEPTVGSLGTGHSGSRVLALEEALAAQGYLTEAEVDGWFDDATEAAVRRLQEDRGLEIDGLAGPRTHAELGIEYAAVAERPDLEARPPDAITLPCDGRWVLALGSTTAASTHPDSFRDRLREEYGATGLELLAADSCASLAPGTWVVFDGEFTAGEAVSAECRARGFDSIDDCLGIPLTDDVADRSRRVGP